MDGSKSTSRKQRNGFYQVELQQFEFNVRQLGISLYGVRASYNSP